MRGMRFYWLALMLLCCSPRVMRAQEANPEPPDLLNENWQHFPVGTWVLYHFQCPMDPDEKDIWELNTVVSVTADKCVVREETCNPEQGVIKSVENEHDLKLGAGLLKRTGQVTLTMGGRACVTEVWENDEPDSPGHKMYYSPELKMVVKREGGHAEAEPEDLNAVYLANGRNYTCVRIKGVMAGPCVCFDSQEFRTDSVPGLLVYIKMVDRDGAGTLEQTLYDWDTKPRAVPEWEAAKSAVASFKARQDALDEEPALPSRVMIGVAVGAILFAIVWFGWGRLRHQSRPMDS